MPYDERDEEMKIHLRNRLKNKSRYWNNRIKYNINHLKNMIKYRTHFLSKAPHEDSSQKNFISYNKEFSYLKQLKLHLGCGRNYKAQWINVDNNTDNNIEKCDIFWNLSKGIPFESNSVDFIYNEHFIEHLSYEEGFAFLQECYRVLKPGGCLRVACPDLDAIIHGYINDTWREAEWIKNFNYEWIPSGAYMLNLSLNHWGHKYVYNRPDLMANFKRAGFKEEHVIEVAFNKSTHKELENLETRQDSMIFEVKKGT